MIAGVHPAAPPLRFAKRLLYVCVAVYCSCILAGSFGGAGRRVGGAGEGAGGPAEEEDGGGQEEEGTAVSPPPPHVCIQSGI